MGFFSRFAIGMRQNISLLIDSRDPFPADSISPQRGEGEAVGGLAGKAGFGVRKGAIEIPSMIPVKVECGCGQRYAFDVEPVNGRMPASVVCPVCGADGTAAANESITRALAAQPPTIAAAPSMRLRPATSPDAPPIPEAGAHTTSPSSPVQRLSQDAKWRSQQRN